MKIRYREFFTQLIGARLCDDERMSWLDLEGWLWSSFAFGDDGVHHIQRTEPDWGDVTKMPGYYEPEGFVIQ